MYRPQHPQRERRAPQPHALAEMDKAHPIPHDGNMHHPIVIGWQQVGQPSSAIATPHFNDRILTNRPTIAAAVAMPGHTTSDLGVRLRSCAPRAFPAQE